MPDNQIRIIPKLREKVAAECLAAALLELIEHLSAEDRRKLIAEGDRALTKAEGNAKPKGSAA